MTAQDAITEAAEFNHFGCSLLSLVAFAADHGRSHVARVSMDQARELLASGERAVATYFINRAAWALNV